MKLSRDALLYTIVVLISFLAPLVSYAGVSLIYTSSTITGNVNASPPITWTQGADYTQAQGAGFAGSFGTSDNAASFTITVSGLSGGSVTIDKLVNVVATSVVSTFKVEISTAKSGTLDPTTFKLRFWTGATAPTGDGSAGVLGVLDLEAALGTATAAMAGAQTIFVQLVYVLPSAASGTVSVSIQPSNIVLV